jgi:hypothetical protein
LIHYVTSTAKKKRYIRLNIFCSIDKQRRKQSKQTNNNKKEEEKKHTHTHTQY